MAETRLAEEDYMGQSHVRADHLLPTSEACVWPSHYATYPKSETNRQRHLPPWPHRYRDCKVCDWEVLVLSKLACPHAIILHLFARARESLLRHQFKFEDSINKSVQSSLCRLNADNYRTATDPLLHRCVKVSPPCGDCVEWGTDSRALWHIDSILWVCITHWDMQGTSEKLFVWFQPH
jgi:hypothetical protein